MHDYNPILTVQDIHFPTYNEQDQYNIPFIASNRNNHHIDRNLCLLKLSIQAPTVSELDKTI